MAQEHRRSPREPERRERSAPRTRSTQSRPAPARRRNGGASFALLYVIFVIGISALLACIGWVAANDVLALNKPEKTATITIREEDSFGDVVTMLKENDLIEYKSLFKLFAAFTGGRDKIVAGTFTLNSDMDYRALISGMSANSATKATVKVTIPEGYSIDQIFALLKEKSVVSDTAKLEDEAANHDYAFSFLQDLPLGDYHRLEGYLFPDTYDFYAGEDPKYVINKMLANFERKMEDYFQQIANQGQTLREIVNIASMIEKETDGTDQTTIASVIFNRLNNNSGGTYGYLQIDATIQYVLPERKENLSDADKEIDSRYNTYKYPGLPEGPICNPGMAALYAAMNPESTSYYYYALGDDNVHHFFKTYNEQQAFIATQERYQ